MYIVHPMWFYLYGLIGNLIAALIVLLGVGCALIIINGIAYADNGIDANKENALKRLRISSISALFFGFLLIIIPSQTTMLRMAAASYATKENVGKMVETGKELKNTLKTDIIDLIKAIQTEKQSNKNNGDKNE